LYSQKQFNANPSDIAAPSVLHTLEFIIDSHELSIFWHLSVTQMQDKFTSIRLEVVH
jgi:hypothetical protein